MKNPNKIMSDFIELLKIIPLEQVDTFIKVMIVLFAAHREKLKLAIEEEEKEKKSKIIIAS